jgi:MOSC domain-containing protein YiiM
VEHLTRGELEAGLDGIRQSPRDTGVIRLIVRRPAEDEREILDEGNIDLQVGLVGDNWSDDGPDPDRQITVTNARVIELLAQAPDRWALAGDQLYVDFVLSQSNLPPGTQLAVGSAVLEVTSEPHTGCAKFRRRFGPDALSFVNSDVGKALRLRGMNTKVVQAGTVRPGDTIRKYPAV